MTPALLIADCGATSGKWAVVDRLSGAVSRFTTGPVNPSVYSPEQIDSQLAIAAGYVAGIPLGEVEMYVAGAVGEAAGILAARAAAAFSLDPGRVRVETDLTGACRGLLGDRRGIVCILGTGSNSSLWSGASIEINIPPMGYILGDEGSGAAIGAALLRQAIRALMPPELMEKWHDAYPGLSYPSLVEAVYREHKGSGYIASFASFAASNADHPYIHRLLRDIFARFFTEVVCAYKEVRALPLAFTGGVAATFSDILRETADDFGLMIESIEPDPLDRLIDRAVKS